MLVLDDTYISPEVFEFAQTTQEPVFDNESARRYVREGMNLNIVNKAEALHGRIIAFSEAYLDEVKYYCDSETQRAIALCKDKAQTRRALSSLFPRYVFKEVSLNELSNIDPSTLALPVVLKPSTGFFSLGIYPIFTAEDWSSALKDIAQHSNTWSNQYGAAVVNNTSFLIESYLDGEEYAVDAYFDEQGKAVVLNIFKHDFAGSEDVSDRLYYTSAEIIKSLMQPISNFLVKSNEIFGFKNFPVHVEVRIGSDGIVNPIEFNPLRFAGLCTTDLAFFAYGFKTYEMYLNNRRPHWGELLQGKEGQRISSVILSTDGTALPDSFSFDYEALAQHFSHVLSLRKMDAKRYNTFGMFFVQAQEDVAQVESEYILHSTLEEFITSH